MKTLITALALTLLSSSALAAPKRVAPFEAPFFTAMNIDDPDVVVGTNGPLELVVRCVQVGEEDAIRLLFRSSVDDWSWAQGASRVERLLLPAGEVAFAAQTANGEVSAGANGATALAPTGEVLMLASIVAVTGDILPPFDCVAAGVATMIKGKLAP